MSMFGRSPSIGRRAGQQAQIVPGSNFTPGQFAAPMPQPKQRPMVTANPPFAANEPVQVKRPANAQLGSSTPMSQPAYNAIPYDTDILAALAAAGPPDGPTPQTPTEPMPDPVTPVQPPPIKAPSLPEAMAAKAASGSLTMQDVLAARQAGDNILAESILQALAGNGWNYARPNRVPVNPGFVAPAASWYDRSGAGPGIGAIPSPQMNDDQTRPAQAQQPPRRYRTFAPGAAGGIYPG